MKIPVTILFTILVLYIAKDGVSAQGNACNKDKAVQVKLEKDLLRGVRELGEQHNNLVKKHQENQALAEDLNVRREQYLGQQKATLRQQNVDMASRASSSGSSKSKRYKNQLVAVDPPHEEGFQPYSNRGKELVPVEPPYEEPKKHYDNDVMSEVGSVASLGGKSHRSHGSKSGKAPSQQQMLRSPSVSRSRNALQDDFLHGGQPSAHENRPPSLKRSRSILSHGSDVNSIASELAEMEEASQKSFGKFKS